MKLKNIDLRKLMSYLGIPFYWSETERGPYVLAKVPWREDRHPSFIAHLKGGRWLWYDIAREEGGSVIDFVMRFGNLPFREAVVWLEERRKDIERMSVLGQLGQRIENETTYWIESIREPDSRIAHIWELRYIPSWLKVGDRIAMQHRIRTGKDGRPEVFAMEKKDTLPVLVFIGTCGPCYWRDILPTRSRKGWLTSNEPILYSKGYDVVYVVEGYTDALAIYQIAPYADIAVLGTVANVRKLWNLPHSKIYIATDNDEAGERAYRELKKRFPHAQRFVYEGKDPMEAWLSGCLLACKPKV